MHDQLPKWLQETALREQLPAWLKQDPTPKKKKPLLPSLYDVMPGLGRINSDLDKTIKRTPGALLDILKGIVKDPSSLAGTGDLRGALVGAAARAPVAGRLKAALRFWVPGEAKPREYTGAAHPMARLDAEDELGDLLDENFEPRFREDVGFLDESGKWYTREEALKHAKKTKQLGNNPKYLETINRLGKLNSEALKQSKNVYAEAVDTPVRTFAEHEPDDAVRELARAYNKERGLADIDDFTPSKHPEPLFRQISSWYEQAKNDPADPEVIAAYKAFNDETHAQYEALKKAGYKFEPTEDAVLDAYPDARSMREDVGTNKRLKVFTGGTPNALMTPEQNFEFRAVHDVMAHSGGGYEFHPDGEFNAALKHSQMYSPEAQRALFTETVGQNANLNYGAHGDYNRANMGKEIFPEQKAAVVPQDFIDQMVRMREPERVVATVTKYRGKEYDAPTHAMGIEAAREEAEATGSRLFSMPLVDDNYFRTSHGRVVPRKEGLAIARAVNQTKEQGERGVSELMDLPGQPWADKPVAAPAIISKESWRPTERGVFDRSAPNLQGTAEPDPRLFASMQRGEASPLHQAIGESPVVEGGLLDDALEGLPRGGASWYELGPLKSFFEQLDGPHKFDDWVNASGAGSIQNPTHNELASASALLFGKKRGLGWEKVKEEFARMHPKEQKLWLSAGIAKNFERADKAGLQLPTTPGNPDRKVPWYSQGKQGGSRSGFPALDTHERRRLLQLARQDPKLEGLLKEAGIPDDPMGLLPIGNALDYEAVGQPFQRLANLLDLPSTQAAQAGRWLGGGEHTGLASAPFGDYVQTLEDGLLYTARLRGLDESPAGLRKLAGSILGGDDFFAPVYSRKGGFPGITGR